MLLLALLLTTATPATETTPLAVDPAPLTSAAPAIPAGAAAAGFVGGGLFALPAVLALAPIAGPFVAIPVGLGIAMGGAAFGGFVGSLGNARLSGAGVVAGVAATGALVGASALGFAAYGLASSSTSVSASDAAFFGLVGVAVGGALGAGAGGAWGATLVPSL